MKLFSAILTCLRFIEKERCATLSVVLHIFLIVYSIYLSHSLPLLHSITQTQITLERDHLRVICLGETVIDKQLHASINTERSKYEIRKTKIEIILIKCESAIWPTIEGDGVSRPKPVKQDAGKWMSLKIVRCCLIYKNENFSDFCF